MLRKIHWIDNSSWTLEKKFENIQKNLKIWINFSNLSNFQIFQKNVKIWKIYSNFSEYFQTFFPGCTTNYLSNIFFVTTYNGKKRTIWAPNSRPGKTVPYMDHYAGRRLAVLFVFKEQILCAMSFLFQSSCNFLDSFSDQLWFPPTR